MRVVSYSKIKQEPLMGHKLKTDRHPSISSFTHCATPPRFDLTLGFHTVVNHFGVFYMNYKAIIHYKLSSVVVCLKIVVSCKCINNNATNLCLLSSRVRPLFAPVSPCPFFLSVSFCFFAAFSRDFSR